MKPILILIALLLCGFKAGDRVYVDPEHKVVARIQSVRTERAGDWDKQRQQETRVLVYRAVWFDGFRRRHWGEFYRWELEAVK